MSRYAVIVDRLLFFVYTDMKMRLLDILAEIPRGSYAILLSVSHIADFSAECYSYDGCPQRETHLPFAALSFFLERIRGLPIAETDVEYFGKVYCLDISDSYIPRFYNIPDKSKQTLSKTAVMSDKTELAYYDIIGERTLRALPVRHAEAVSDAYQRSLLIREEGAADAVITASYDGEINLKSTDCHYPLEYVAAGVSGLILHGELPPFGEYTAHLCGAAHRVRLCDGEIHFLIKTERLRA